jgi:hypothetical protein
MLGELENQFSSPMQHPVEVGAQKANSYLLTVFSLFAAFSLHAQTTNLARAVPWFREVNGQLYDVTQSVLWAPVEGKCVSVQSNGILVQTFVTNAIYDSVAVHPQAKGNVGIGAFGAPLNYTSKRLIDLRVEPDKVLFVAHYAEAARDYHLPAPADGQQIRIPAILAGTVQAAASTLESWDCGLPHFVPTTNAAPRTTPQIFGAPLTFIERNPKPTGPAYVPPPHQ